MKRFPGFLLLVSLLVGCAGHSPLPEVAEYGLPAPATGASSLLRTVEISGASWLAGKGIPYRLAYADPDRRAVYANSLWLAPPAEMLERLLGRSLAGEGKSAPGVCRLRIELDEFQQVFDTPQGSRGELALRATLLAQGGAPLGRRSFSLSRPAGSPDAQGGVRALGLAAGDVSVSLRQWLDGQAPEVAQACRVP
ncbi:MAG: ABC-type transport auxiliary lipoprotein family protein [Rhodocyclaceae bacterium]|nr:ABC-type transport auxiliary lipoprotein family protein [Rhodocyclaceae bacterium]